MTIQGHYYKFKHNENLLPQMSFCLVLDLICQLPFSVQRKLKRALVRFAFVDIADRGQ